MSRYAALARSTKGARGILSDNDAWIAASAEGPRKAVLLTCDRDFLALHPAHCTVQFVEPSRYICRVVGLVCSENRSVTVAALMRWSRVRGGDGMAEAVRFTCDRDSPAGWLVFWNRSVSVAALMRGGESGADGNGRLID